MEGGRNRFDDLTQQKPSRRERTVFSRDHYSCSCDLTSTCDAALERGSLDQHGRRACACTDGAGLCTLDCLVCEQKWLSSSFTARNNGRKSFRCSSSKTLRAMERRSAAIEYVCGALFPGPMVRFMVKHLTLIQCNPISPREGGDKALSKDVPPKLLIASCPPHIAGGFSPSAPDRPPAEAGILLCANRIFSKSHLEDTLAHEMIHWWDHCRFQVDWSNLRHHACSEVRSRD